MSFMFWPLSHIIQTQVGMSSILYYKQITINFKIIRVTVTPLIEDQQQSHNIKTMSSERLIGVRGWMTFINVLDLELTNFMKERGKEKLNIITDCPFPCVQCVWMKLQLETRQLLASPSPAARAPRRVSSRPLSAFALTSYAGHTHTRHPYIQTLYGIMIRYVKLRTYTCYRTDFSFIVQLTR